MEDENFVYNVDSKQMFKSVFFKKKKTHIAVVENESMQWKMDFPGGSESKESACNAGDPDSIP